MLFGQSVFQSVLTRLKEERSEEDAEEPDYRFRIKGLGLGFVASTQDGPPADGVGPAAEAYLAFAPEPSDVELPAHAPEAPPVPQPPPHLLRLTQEEVAEELAITAADTHDTLTEKRRRFAKANHPDGVPPELRENASIRMKTANLLIDNAMKAFCRR